MLDFYSFGRSSCYRIHEFQGLLKLFKKYIDSLVQTTCLNLQSIAFYA